MKRQLIVPSLLLCAASVVAAQETTGDIRGRLRTESAGPIADAQITATSTDLLGARRTVSARDGVFLLLALPPGIYTLRVRAIGYRALIIQEVPVRLGRTSGLDDLSLEPATVQLDELTVTAPRVSLDPVRTTIGATLEAEDYAALPAERDYKSLIAILPHVNTSYHGDPVNSGGSTGLENMYFIDGVNVTSPGTASTGTSLPYNFVRSVEVRAGGYEAQYGRALGAIVNAVTYTGTNEFEASVFGFMTSSGLAAESRAQPTLRESGAVSYDVGARVSGPVVRDRLWFSAAYNPRVDRVDREVAALGSYPANRTAHVFAGKLSWQASTVTSVELSLFGDQTTHDQVGIVDWMAGFTPVNPDPYLQRLTSGGVTASLRGTAMVGSHIRVEAGVAHATGSDRQSGATQRARTDPLLTDYLAGTIEGGVPSESGGELGRTAGTLRGTMQAGRHTVVLGVEYEDTWTASTFLNPGIGYIERTDTATYLVYDQAFGGTVRNRIPTAYLQDSWRVSERLTGNAGVRWSSQFLIGASGGVAQRFPDEWQPRLGFNWHFGRAGSQRILGSYGRFYQQEPLALAAGYFVDFFGTVTTYATDPRQPGATPVSAVNFSSLESDYANSIPGLQVEHFDEFTLGYERLVGGAARLTVRAVRRELRSSFQQAIDSLHRFLLGTPGKGNLSFLPPPRRAYTALEVSVEGARRRLQYRASYVLSRTWGNYSGLHSSDNYLANPGNNGGLGTWLHATNTTGLLPNDRTHVVKIVASYRAGRALTAGAFVTWQSGTPLNKFGSGPLGSIVFLSPRGSVGRTPAIWDLNLRLAYEAHWARRATTRFVFDVLHLGNPQAIVRQNLQHEFPPDAQGNPNINPDYLKATAFQPPMVARLGFELSF